MPYDTVNHPLLSEDAKALGGPEITAQQRVAERVLGLTGTGYTGTAKLEAEDALAMQVSLQVATDPMTFLAQSETKGIESITYRDTIPIHPMALEIAKGLFAENLGSDNVWPTIPSLR